VELLLETTEELRAVQEGFDGLGVRLNDAEADREAAELAAVKWKQAFEDRLISSATGQTEAGRQIADIVARAERAEQLAERRLAEYKRIDVDLTKQINRALTAEARLEQLGEVMANLDRDRSESTDAQQDGEHRVAELTAANESLSFHQGRMLCACGHSCDDHAPASTEEIEQGECTVCKCQDFEDPEPYSLAAEEGHGGTRE
jgi:DNA repair exonuclease SbcCD ATPase subunit